MKRSIFEIYSYFVSKVYSQNYQYFYLNPSKKQIRAAIDFSVALITLQQRIDRDYLFDYCAYQFDWILKKNPRYNETRVPFHQVFSKTSIDRWLDVDEGYMYYISSELHEKGIKREDVVKVHVHSRTPIELIEVEEIEKQRFHNSERGFAHCLLFTTLYNPKSISCLRCSYNIECQELQKKKSPAVWYDRKRYVES